MLGYICLGSLKTVRLLLSSAHSLLVVIAALAGPFLSTDHRVHTATATSRSTAVRDPSGGTQRTGTREADNNANAVPCGPGVPLARFTPATRMQG